MSKPILEVKNLRVSFDTKSGTLQAIRGVSFTLEKGKTLAIVGESGSGKGGHRHHRGRSAGTILPVQKPARPRGGRGFFWPCPGGGPTAEHTGSHERAPFSQKAALHFQCTAQRSAAQGIIVPKKRNDKIPSGR